MEEEFTREDIPVHEQIIGELKRLNTFVNWRYNETEIVFYTTFGANRVMFQRFAKIVKKCEDVAYPLHNSNGLGLRLRSGENLTDMLSILKGIEKEDLS